MREPSRPLKNMGFYAASRLGKKVGAIPIRASRPPIMDRLPGAPSARRLLFPLSLALAPLY